MSALGQKRTHASQQTSILFDHLAGPERQSWRDVQSDDVGGLEVDYQLVLGRCLNRQFARFLAAQNAISIGCSPSPLIDLIRPIGHQPALSCEISERIDSWQAVPGRRKNDRSAVRDEAGMWRNDQSTIGLACKRGDCALDLDTALDIYGRNLDAK